MPIRCSLSWKDFLKLMILCYSVPGNVARRLSVKGLFGGLYLKGERFCFFVYNQVMLTNFKGPELWSATLLRAGSEALSFAPSSRLRLINDLFFATYRKTSRGARQHEDDKGGDQPMGSIPSQRIVRYWLAKSLLVGFDGVSGLELI